MPRIVLALVSLCGLLLAMPLATNAAYSQTNLSLREQGYRRIAFDDFVIDGNEFAKSGAKISIQGFYLKMGEVETLFRSGNIVPKTTDGILLLTDDASRDIRKYFLECRNASVYELMPTLGCQVKILGHGSRCTKITLAGAKSVPCMVVEDGWGPTE
jgi:hypothetical protein